MSSEVQDTAAVETNSGTEAVVDGEMGLISKLAEAAAALRIESWEAKNGEVVTTEEPVVETPAEEVKAEEAVPSEEAQAEAKTEEAKAEETDPRFAALAKRERDLLTRHKEVKEAHSQLEAARKQVELYEQAKRNASVDPVAFIKSLALDLPLDQVAKALWYDVLGDDAPAEAKQDKRFTVMEAKLRQTEAKLEAEQKAREERDRAEATRTQIASFQTELRSYVEKSEVPEVKLRFTKQADAVLDDLLNVAAALGDAGDEEWMNPEKVTSALEQKYRDERARFESLYGPVPAKNQASVGATKNEAAPRTLSNRIANQTAPAPEPSEEERFKRAEQMFRDLNASR